LRPGQPFRPALQSSHTVRCVSVQGAKRDSVFLGLDFGTSGARAMAIDGRSDLVLLSQEPHLDVFTHCRKATCLRSCCTACATEAGKVVASTQQGYGDQAAADWPKAWHRCGPADKAPVKLQLLGSCQAALHMIQSHLLEQTCM